MEKYLLQKVRFIRLGLERCFASSESQKLKPLSVHLLLKMGQGTYNDIRDRNPALKFLEFWKAISIPYIYVRKSWFPV